MPSNGYYDLTSDSDNVTDDGSINGWAGGNSDYGKTIAGRKTYSFGPRQHGYGTWAQFIYDGDNLSLHQDHGNPSGLNGRMPNNPAPGNSTWVQGHLVLGEIGGSGKMADNLIPISHNLNMAHKDYEAVIKYLVNRGGLTKYFNPNGIANSYLIYRVHALAPPAGTPPAATFPHVPAGIVISLGFVIDRSLKSLQQVKNELNGRNDNARQSARRSGVPYQPRWFHADYYKTTGPATERAEKIKKMVGGHMINY